MVFVEKVLNVKLKKEYTEILFIVDENDANSGYQPGSVCALRIDHESEIFRMTDNKNLIVSELLKIQTVKTVSELIEYLNKQGYIYSITQLSSGHDYKYKGLDDDDDLEVDVNSVYQEFGNEDDDTAHQSHDEIDNSMYERSKSLEGYMKEKFDDPEPDKDELSLDLYSRYKDYEKYMK